MNRGWLWSLPPKAAKTTEDGQATPLATFGQVGHLRHPEGDASTPRIDVPAPSGSRVWRWDGAAWVLVRVVCQDQNQPPVLKVAGEKTCMVKVDQPIELSAVATDDGLPRVAGRRAGTADDAGAAAGGSQAGSRGGGGLAVGGDSVRGVAKGLRLAWYVYRGKNVVSFDPPQFKVWEDQRGGSPWAPSWVNPPIPPDNDWIVHVTFQEPGTYVLRCQPATGSGTRMKT